MENFTYHDENNKDQGINSEFLLSIEMASVVLLIFLVRHKVKEFIEFVQDDDRIRDERKRAKANRDKYVGMSHESSSYRYSKYIF